MKAHAPWAWTQLARHRTLRCLLIVGLAASLLGFVVDAVNTARYGGADYRPRVVGYRLAAAGKDPYRSFWKPGLSDRYVDPYLSSRLDLTRTTVTPTALLLNAPLDLLSYRAQRAIWLVVQWLLLLGMLFLASRWMRCDQRLVLWAAGTAFVCGSYFWRLHVERGQIYVVYAFVMAAVYLTARRGGRAREVTAGVILGLLIALRPPYAVVLIPIALARKGGLVAASVLGTAAAVALPAALFGPSIWLKYATAMGAQGAQYLRWFGPPPPAAAWYPSVVEGRVLWSNAKIPSVDSSFARALHNLRLDIGAGELIACMVVVAAVLAALFWFGGRHRIPRIEVVLLQGGVLAYVAEYFLAATRFSYRDVMIVPLLILLMTVFDLASLRRSGWAWAGLTGLVLGCISVSWLPHIFDYGTIFLGEMLVTASLVVLSSRAGRQQEPLAQRECRAGAWLPAPRLPETHWPGSWRAP